MKIKDLFENSTTKLDQEIHKVVSILQQIGLDIKPIILRNSNKPSKYVYVVQDSQINELVHSILYRLPYDFYEDDGFIYRSNGKYRISITTGGDNWRMEFYGKGLSESDNETSELL